MTSVPGLLVASKNPDKIREISNALSGLQLCIVSMYDVPALPDVDEDRDTLQGNAIKKARELSRAAGLPALADDTGLEVDALNGAPGVYSARYAGPNARYEDNVTKLLTEMQGKRDRTARFRTVAALVWGDHVRTVEGVCEGEILTERRGDGGFGYDPVFYIPEYNQTFAEMSLSLKNKISHRGKAIGNIKPMVMELLQDLPND
ncbi:MAG: RdgB/HAM1 family non-canonical purine NTP pyrophosphatase [candidate division KSB1 bacterium]|nr:RdgB/HAM1 family non-canonical purine NTP pyrophosphatase [candidate division KSB1 bacterium]